jgi:hypothetical protein
MQELLAAVQETGKKIIMRQLMGFVARCVIMRTCTAVQAWKAGVEVQKAVAVTRHAEWIAPQEVLYTIGMVPGLPSDGGNKLSYRCACTFRSLTESGV